MIKILELGHEPLFRDNAPEGAKVEYYCVGRANKWMVKGSGLSWVDLPRLYERVMKGEFDLVVAHVQVEALWDWRRVFWSNLGRAVFKPLQRPYAYFTTVFFSFFKRVPVPLILYNRCDVNYFYYQNRKMLSLCTLYFVRELPQNYWAHFLHSTRKCGDVENVRRQAVFRDNVHKLRPMSLGVGLGDFPCYSSLEEKRFDIFYSGENHKTTVRSEGVKELESLKSSFQVYIPERRLSREEFYEACARALITWSPEGAGWDCFRHYEALACGSVPLINYPTIARYAPLVEGKHCLFYSPERGGLTAAVERALEDKVKLMEMAREGREFVFKYHNSRRIVEYMIEETMEEWRRVRGRAGEERGQK